MVAVPMPKKKSFIIPLRLQWSASQPAGIENVPKAMKPPRASGVSSAYDCCYATAMASTAVGKISIARWSTKWPTSAGRSRGGRGFA